MRLAIHQPNFVPRLKVLQKVASADCWIVLDNVQFAKREWQNRARLATTHSDPSEFWLTLPVRLPDGQRTLIRDVIVCDLHRTLQKCRSAIIHAFRSAPYWNAVEQYWMDVESSIASDRLVDVVLPTMTVALERFAVLPRITRSSQLDAGGQKSRLMANLCREAGADCYLADSGAIDYLDEGQFDYATVVWQNWTPPVGVGGEAIRGLRNLAFIGYLARFGPDRLRAHLQSGTFVTRQTLTGFISEMRPVELPSS